MNLRMGDGPVKNLPSGLDVYAGYDDVSGIGETWREVQKIPARFHLSISTVPGVAAMMADVEKGALASWKGYTVGYCAISQAQALILRDGRPKKLLTAHHNDIPHICTSACGFGFTGEADGTQWTNHGGAWDESLLKDGFFDFLQSPIHIVKELENVQISIDGSVIVGNDPTPGPNQGHLMVAEKDKTSGKWSVTDVTDEIKTENPNDPRTYTIS